MAVETESGYALYLHMPGRVVRAFNVPRHGLKLVIEYPSQTNRHGQTYQPHRYETFARRVRAI